MRWCCACFRNRNHFAHSAMAGEFECIHEYTHLDLGYVASMLLILVSQSIFIRRLIPKQISVGVSGAQWVGQI